MHTMRKLLPWLAATLAVAVAVHLATMWYLPQIVMGRAMAQMGAVNTIHHGQRASAEIHGVVRPSPDLLYSVCPFDLSKGPLHVQAPVPAGTYWSVSMFDDATNNFFVLNDRQTKSGTVDLLIFGPGAMVKIPFVPHEGAPQLVVSPSLRGLVVFRTLIADEKNLAAIDTVRRQAKCTLL